MRRFPFRTTAALALAGFAGASAVLLAQAMKPGHERVPPARDPSPYMSQADIQTGLSKLDPKLVSSRTGGAIDFAKDKAPGVVRRRMRGPQYAITHTRTVEYMIVTKGTATLVTGGTLIPPTIDSDPYPNSNPNATIRSEVGVKVVSLPSAARGGGNGFTGSPPQGSEEEAEGQVGETHAAAAFGRPGPGRAHPEGAEAALGRGPVRGELTPSAGGDRVPLRRVGADPEER